jgi:hypothetical protein
MSCLALNVLISFVYFRFRASSQYLHNRTVQQSNSLFVHITKNSNHPTSPTYSYEVKKLPIGEINGDGSIDMGCISIAIDRFMQATP